PTGPRRATQPRLRVLEREAELDARLHAATLGRRGCDRHARAHRPRRQGRPDRPALLQHPLARADARDRAADRAVRRRPLAHDVSRMPATAGSLPRSRLDLPRRSRAAGGGGWSAGRSRANAAAMCRSTSMYASSATSNTTFVIVPPVNANFG